MSGRPDDPAPAGRRGIHRGEAHRTHAARRTGDVERAYFCRACNLTTRAANVPPGWYLLDRAPGGRGRHLRLGMYCSLTCLLEHAEQLRAGERAHAGHLGLAADADRDRARLLERADTMLSAGLTLRQAAGALDLTPAALRTWLRAAGKPTQPTEHTAPVAQVTDPARPDHPQGVAHMSSTAGPGGAPSPISVLHQLRDAGHLLALAITVTSADGPDHQRTFTAEARAETPRTDGGASVITGRGTGPTKAAAKTAAAVVLLRRLTPAVGDTRRPG